MSTRLTLPIVAAAMALTAAACGDTTADASSTSVPASSATIVADAIAFDVTSIETKVGSELTITFENRDEGVTHNLRVRGAGDDAATEIQEGPVTQTLTLTLADAGELTYVCDVHPVQMTGTLTVVG